VSRRGVERLERQQVGVATVEVEPLDAGVAAVVDGLRLAPAGGSFPEGLGERLDQRSLAASEELAQRVEGAEGRGELAALVAADRRRRDGLDTERGGEACLQHRLRQAVALAGASQQRGELLAHVGLAELVWGPARQRAEIVVAPRRAR
jgi:hypothetical protein